MLSQTLAHVREGWSVFPIAPRGKEPLTRRGCKDASRSIGEVVGWWTRWPEANIGLATGERYWVIDIDGEQGEQSWLDLSMHHSSDTWATRSVRTPGGGWHMIYRVPRGARLRNSASRLAPGVDTRGVGGYIVGAGSVHPNGGVYTLEADIKPLLAPRWVLKIISEWDKPVVRLPRVVDGHMKFDSPAEAKLTELRRSANGHRNDTLNSVAYWFASQGLTGARGDIERAAAECGLSEFETRKTIDSAFSAANGGTRSVVPQYAIGV